ncbi:aldo/keto reductase [Stakelama sediminis]|uniref:Aryl-alcohol dehydrogenase-like predicted oxidoreductase n=1 Tax=Stakelama sediminis TaxID=463200 RepID=A0A840YWQ8_9SPHN|nr:aldo/keto reductase [Stakelama sediminis]MBB5717987.1 aryl-alcohol dehydrogenase-like predicted oxidoreductase [Stakelama sediminis]
MRYTQLGSTGLMVSELCLGTMTFGGQGFFKAVGQVQQDEADTLMGAAIDAGVNFIDTANVYSEGLSEEITGKAIKNLGLKREDVVLATKVLGPMGEGPNARGASRGHIMDQVRASLKRLGTDHIDLYQIHGWDPLTPIEETLRALDDLVRAGDVRYVGVSNWAAWQIAKALGISERDRLARFETVQAYYTLAGRDLERELVPMMRSEGVGLMVWSPLAGGYLSGKYRKNDAEGRRANFDFPPVDMDRGETVLDAMEPIAKAHGVSMAQIALAWLLHQPHVTSVIMGAKRLDQLQDNLAAADVTLNDDQLAALDTASALPAEYPGWMIERQSEYRSGAVAGSPPAQKD